MWYLSFDVFLKFLPNMFLESKAMLTCSGNLRASFQEAVSSWFLLQTNTIFTLDRRCIFYEGCMTVLVRRGTISQPCASEPPADCKQVLYQEGPGQALNIYSHGLSSSWKSAEEGAILYREPDTLKKLIEC